MFDAATDLEAGEQARGDGHIGQTGVESVLALSAMMIVSSMARPAPATSSVSMEAARPDSSLCTGTTRSTVVDALVGVDAACSSGRSPAMFSSLMGSRLLGWFGPSIGRSCGPAVDAVSWQTALSQRVIPATLGFMSEDHSPAPQRRIRASDKDRDDVLSVITEAVTNGRLDPEETAERQDEAISAKFVDGLMPLIDDLPEGEQLHRRFARQTGHPQNPGSAGPGSELGRLGPTELSPAAEPGSAQPLNSVAIMSGREIDVPAGTAEVTSYALMGGDNIDLCSVMGPGVTIELNCYAMWAGHDVYVPPGVRILDETINIMAGNEIHRAARGDGSNGTVILKGFSLMAGHDVRLAKGYRAKDQGQLE